MPQKTRIEGSTSSLLPRVFLLVVGTLYSNYFIGAIAQTISWGNAANDQVLKVDSNKIDASYVVQLGRFVNGFDPAANPTSLWATNWRAFDEASDANGGLNVNLPTSTFISRSNAMNIDGTTPVEPFDAVGFDFRSPSGDPEQAYMWIFNDLDGDVDSEWALVTDSTWVFPETVVPTSSELWRTGATTTSVYGTFTEGDTFNTFQLDAVPEPSTSMLGLVGFFALVLIRRR